MASLKLCFLSLMFIIICTNSRLIDASRNKTTLKDLDYDLLYIIFEPYSSLRDIITLTNASDYFSPIARHILKRNYANRTTLKVPAYGYPVIGVDTQQNDTIYTNSNSFVRCFGDLFTKITIDHWPPYNSTERIKKIAKANELINLYCADTLIELEIHSEPLFDLDVMKKPFEKLEVLSLQGNLKISSAHAFKALFPSLRELSLNSIQSLDTNFIVNHYPHLERVHLDASQFQNSTCMSLEVFGEFLRKNPQIRTFTMKNNFKGVLEAVNELLPDLEHLELHKYHSYTRTKDENEVLFENVKNFTIVFDHPPKNILFKNLVEFRSSGNLHYHEPWIDFVEKNPNLQRLYVEIPLADNAQVARLTTIASNLTDISLQFRDEVYNENILNLVRCNPKLKRMHLNARFLSNVYGLQNYSFESVAVLLQEEFGDEFEIVTESEKQLLMTRLD